MNLSQDQKIEKINDFYKLDGYGELNKEDITDSLIDKLYDLMFTEKEFNEHEITDSNEIYYFGNFYHTIKKYDKMKKYYFRAIELNNSNAMNDLGFYYQYKEKNYDLMKKYYVMSIQLNNMYAMTNLGDYYYSIEKNYDLMKKYYLMAIDKGDIFAILHLAIYYKNDEKSYDLMKKYYMMAVQAGSQLAIKKFKKYYISNTDYSFLELYDCDHFRETCTELINKKFTCDNIICLPNKYKQIFLKLDFSNNDKIDNTVKLRQNIYKMTLIFPSNYNSKYLEQFKVIESIVQNNECTMLNKDLLLHIAGRLFI